MQMMIFSRFNFDLIEQSRRGKRVNEPKFSKARICIIGEPSRCGLPALRNYTFLNVRQELEERMRPVGEQFALSRTAAHCYSTFSENFQMYLRTTLSHFSLNYVKAFYLFIPFSLFIHFIQNGWNTLKTPRIFPILKSIKMMRYFFHSLRKKLGKHNFSEM